MKKEHHHEDLKTLHPMRSFGVVSGITNQVRVTRLEDRLNPAVPFPHKHNFYHLVFITKGSGWHEIDFKRHAVKSGAMFFMMPAQVHSWAMSKDTCGIVVEFENLSMFSGDESFVLTEALRPAASYLSLTGEKKASMSGLYQTMLEEYEAEFRDFEILLRLNLAQLIILFSRFLKSTPVKVSRISKFRDEFNELIEKNYKTHHNVEFYAKAMGVATKSLTAKVNRNLGKNVREIIQDRCILESKRLLAYSDLSVSEIALELGFEDPNYFTRFFKLKTKTNPGKFRQKVRHIC
ncbi:AraC family transcriptional regulator [Bacteriovorax sp. PP10]|uniref:AraC family transcriptional regulator n=1 Tax=Bacteriovorax antarcticus TaxID=3088717 RepID=A0ABU5VU15_9BACT|nr:AraC family transcriptional regulator [Bacteriovorax sp. PP10]MEA9356102.1 AraC family transcriptional regulator [Bacteriovorax sp. PP10]